MTETPSASARMYVRRRPVWSAVESRPTWTVVSPTRSPEARTTGSSTRGAAGSRARRRAGRRRRRRPGRSRRGSRRAAAARRGTLLRDVDRPRDGDPGEPERHGRDRRDRPRPCSSPRRGRRGHREPVGQRMPDRRELQNPPTTASSARIATGTVIVGGPSFPPCGWKCSRDERDWLAAEDDEDHPEGVGAGQERARETAGEEHVAVPAARRARPRGSSPSRRSRRGRHADEREPADPEADPRERHQAPQPAHLADVLLAGERVDDDARREEEQRLEEGVRHQVEHRRSRSRRARRRGTCSRSGTWSSRRSRA